MESKSLSDVVVKCSLNIVVFMVSKHKKLRFEESGLGVMREFGVDGNHGYGQNRSSRPLLYRIRAKMKQKKKITK